MDTAPAKKATQLRLKGGIKSPIVKDLEKGETLTILDAGDSWTKAMTEDGVIGYLKNKFVGKVTTETLSNEFTEPEFTHISKDFTIEMAWHQVTTKGCQQHHCNSIAEYQGNQCNRTDLVLLK